MKLTISIKIEDENGVYGTKSKTFDRDPNNLFDSITAEVGPLYDFSEVWNLLLEKIEPK